MRFLRQHILCSWQKIPFFVQALFTVAKAVNIH